MNAKTLSVCGLSPTGLPVADVQQAANLQYPITGILSANLSVQGSQTNPVGQGSVRLSEARVWDQPIQDLSLQFEGTGSAIHSTLNVRTPAGSGSAKATFYPNEERYEAQVDFPGIHLDKARSCRPQFASGWDCDGFCPGSRHSERPATGSDRRGSKAAMAAEGARWIEGPCHSLLRSRPHSPWIPVSRVLTSRRGERLI